jgi:FixJ family two-component response regulator
MIIVVDDERFMGDGSFAGLGEEGFEVRTFSGPKSFA